MFVVGFVDWFFDWDWVCWLVVVLGFGLGGGCFGVWIGCFGLCFGFDCFGWVVCVFGFGVLFGGLCVGWLCCFFVFGVWGFGFVF